MSGLSVGRKLDEFSPGLPVMRPEQVTAQILHVWNAVREYIVVGRTYWLACHPFEQSRSNDANEWAFSPRPIVAEWARGEPGNASDDEKCTVIQKVSYSNINTGIDVLLIYKYSLNDVLDCVFRDERFRATQPTEDVPPWQRLATLLLREADDLFNCFFYKVCELFPCHCCWSFAESNGNI